MQGTARLGCLLTVGGTSGGSFLRGFLSPSLSRRLSISSGEGKALTIYGFKFSQPTRSLLLLAGANDIPFEFEEVNALKGDNRKGAFRKEFPSGQVPVIKETSGHDDEGASFRLFETPAILTYLCESRLGPSSSWFPQDIFKRAEINAFMHWHHTHSRIATKMVLHPKLYPKLPGQEEKFAQGNKQIKRVLQHLNGILEKNVYLTGDEMTIADLLILCEFDQHRPEITGLIDFTQYPHLERWLYSFDKFPWYTKVFDDLKAAKKELNL